MQQYTQSRQNKVKLISLLVFILLLVVVFFWYRANVGQGNTAQAQESSGNAAMFMGLRPASAKEIHALWPETKGRPLLVEFHSKYCLDCKKMAPALNKAIQNAKAQHPRLEFKAYEVMDDKSANPAVFETFKPVTVPVLVFIRPDGKIQNVLYNYQTQSAISASLSQISTAKTAQSKAP